MYPSTSLDILENRKSLASTENLTTIRRSSAHSLVAKQSTLCRFPSSLFCICTKTQISWGLKAAGA
jgi:hypothetical protein